MFVSSYDVSSSMLRGQWTSVYPTHRSIDSGRPSSDGIPVIEHTEPHWATRSANCRQVKS